VVAFLFQPVHPRLPPREMKRLRILLRGRQIA
jgi:hypothetical protein